MSERFVCVECGQAFILSYDEQRYYREGGWDLPKRCDACRSRRRGEHDSGIRGFSAPSARSNPVAPGQPSSLNRTDPSAFSQKLWSTFPFRFSQRQSRSWWIRPMYRYGAVTFGLTLVLTVIIASFDSPLGFLGAWLVAITIVTFWTFGYDKAIAGRTPRRVPEKVLFALAFFGGTLGAILGRAFFRHKTVKLSFRLKFWALVIVQIVLVTVYYLWIKPRLGQ